MTSTPTMKALKEKADEINLILLSPTVDLWKLRELALSDGGLVNDTLRKRAWPKLVGIHKLYHLPKVTSNSTTPTKSPRKTTQPNPPKSTPTKRPRPTSHEGIRIAAPGTSPTPQAQAQTTKNTHVYELDRFMAEDEFFKNGLAPPSSVPTHDPRDYYNLTTPQMEIDASVVVAADQAAEEAAAAAHNKRRRRGGGGVDTDDSIRDDCSVEVAAPEVLLEPPTPRAGSTSKPSYTSSSAIENTHDPKPTLTSTPPGAVSSSHIPPQQSSNPAASAPPPTVLVECEDVVQIHRDVVRCTWHLLSGSQRSRRLQYKHKDRRKVGSLLHRKQFRLENLLNWTLYQSSYRQQQQSLGGVGDGEVPPVVVEDKDEESLLRYYQGFHDVACIFMAALGSGNNASITGPAAAPTADTTPSDPQEINQESDSNNDGGEEAEEQEWEKINPNERLRDLQEQAMALGLDLPARVLLQLSYSHFRDNLRSSFLQLQTALRIVLFPLLHALDPHGVHAHLVDCDMEPFFCLSWVITWFSHDVRDTELVKRLFDVFIVSHPLFPIYLSIAMMLHPINRRLILTTDCDFAAVHHALSNLPRNSCRVGWKKRKHVGGDDEDHGYVSDDGEPQNPAAQRRGREASRGDTASRQSGADTDDDGTLSTDLDVSLISDGWGSSIPLFEKQHRRGDRADADDEDSKDDAHSSSMLSGSLLSASAYSVGRIGMIPDNERVPFQELIDTAIKYMKRYPPRSLVPLARAYYQSDTATANANDHANMGYYATGPRDRMVMQPPMTDEMWDDVASTITILQPTPPIWSITPFAKSDWVLKQRARECMGLKPTSRKDRRNHSKQKAALAKGVGGEKREGGDEGDDAPMAIVDYDYIKKNCRSPAVIACGFGTGEEEERRRRRRQRLLLTTTSVLIVGLVAISIGLMMNSYGSSNTAAPNTSSTSTTSTSSTNSGSGTTQRSGSDTKKSSPPSSSAPLPKETMSHSGDSTCFDPEVSPSFTTAMVDALYGPPTDNSGEVAGDSFVATTRKIPAEEMSPLASAIKPVTSLVAKVTLRMHRLLYEIRLHWENDLFQPLRQMRLPGFAEEEFLEDTLLGKHEEKSSVLRYAHHLATEAQKEVRRCLDAVGITSAYLSLNVTDDETNDDRNHGGDRSMSKKPHQRRGLGLKGAVTKAVGSWKKNMGDWREGARERRRSQGADLSEDHLPLF